jgi:hypothetical protein
MALNAAPTDASDSSSTVVPALLVAFALFSNLPQELQDKIWKQALPGSRLITITHRLPGALAAFSMSNAGPNIHLLRNTIRALVQPPVLLRVSVASRNIALHHYQPMFQHVLYRPVFVDPDVDILHFYNHRALAAFDQVATATHSNVIESPLIQAVAIPHMHLTTTPRNSLACTMDVIKCWHRTREMYMVSPTTNGPINGFGVGEMKMLLTLHRRLVLDEMTEREKREWEAPNVLFLRVEDLEAICE